MRLNEKVLELLIKNPYYGYLAAKVRFVESEKVSTMRFSFDGQPLLMYNTQWYSDLNNDQQTGVLVHQLLHLALLHFFRRHGRERLIWNVACDMAVSELMPEEQVHKDLVTLRVIEKELGIKLEKGRSAEFYYDALVAVEDRISFLSQAGEAVVIFEGGNEYHGEILEEMMNDDLGMEALIEELTKVQASAASEGVLKGNLAEQAEDIYRPYKVNWRNVLKRFLTGHGKILTRKSYKRQSRRFDDVPGTKRSVGVTALLGIDESASISDEQIHAFHRELLKINKITGADISAVRFDTECSEPVALNQFISGKKRERRGGTDFRPVFHLADSLKSPLVILFTDGDGAAPEAVNQQVLWVLTNNGSKPKDYGLAVKFEE